MYIYIYSWQVEPLIVSWFSDTSKSKTTEKLQICFCLKHSVFNSISRDLPIEHVVSRLFRMAFQWQAFWWNESCSKYLRFQHMELTTKWNKDVYWIIPMSVCDGVSVMYIIYLHNKYICKIHSLCAYCIMNISIISFHFNVYTCVSVYIYVYIYIHMYMCIWRILPIQCGFQRQCWAPDKDLRSSKASAASLTCRELDRGVWKIGMRQSHQMCHGQDVGFQWDLTNLTIENWGLMVI